MADSQASREPTKRKNLGLILGIAAGILLLCWCAPGIGGPAIWYVLQQTPTILAKDGDQGKKKDTKNFSSPNEVVDAMQLASQKDDLRGWCACWTDDSRDLLAASVIIDEFTMMREKQKARTDKQKAHIQAVADVFKQLSLTEEFLDKRQREALTVSHPRAPLKEKVTAAQAILAPIKDRNAFIEDLFKTVQKQSGSEGPLSMWKNAKLTDVKITDKMAEGIVHFRKDKADTFNFRNEPVGWRLDLFAETPTDLPPGHP